MLINDDNNEFSRPAMLW